MTSGRRSKKQRARVRRQAKRRTSLVSVAVVVGVLATAAVATTLVRGDSAERVASDAFVRTGAMNSMGLPVIETPGRVSGFARAGGAEVSGAFWAMGDVPLLAAVLPSWTIVNTSSHPVRLGEPHPEVRQGCCPGPFTFGERSLAPGASTTLTFELAMHPGMDGWHDIAVHVPVTSSAAEVILELGVTGDFHGSL